LNCFCLQSDQTLRQFAAAHKFHDIVLILDQHKATMVCKNKSIKGDRGYGV